MDTLELSELDMADPTVVRAAAHHFAAALAESPQYKAFEQVAERFRRDHSAQQALQAYQEKQNAWRALIMLNALSPEQQTELESLQKAFVSHPLVQEYLKAQVNFASLCQILGDVISESIGLNYAAACGVSCCG